MTNSAAYPAPCRPTEPPSGYGKAKFGLGGRWLDHLAERLSWRVLAIHGRTTAACVILLAATACLVAGLSAWKEQRAVVERNRLAVAQESAKLGAAFAFAIRDSLDDASHYLDLMGPAVVRLHPGEQLALPTIIEPDEVAYVGVWGRDGQLLSGSPGAPAQLPAAARDLEAGQALLDRPVKLGSSQEYVLPLWRAQRDPQGRLVATVGSAIRPSRSLAFFGALMTGRVGVVSLMDAHNKMMVMRSDASGQQAWAMPLPNYDLWPRMEAGEVLTTEIRTSPVDHRQRMIVFSPVPASSMVVLVGTELEELAAQVAPVTRGIRLKATVEITSFIAGALLMLALLRTLSHLHRSLERNQEFLARISHELRTPLNAVIGFSELLIEAPRGPLGSPIYVDYATMIHQSGRNLLTLVDDVLDLTALQAGQLPLECRPLNARAAVEAVMLHFQAAADAKAIRLFVYGDRDHKLIADDQGFGQALGHLVDNAVKFTPEGGRVSVELRDHPVTGRVQVMVSDTGPGMTRAQIRCAGDPFGQPAAYSRRIGEGSGLGLAIVRALVVAHGGQLAIESDGFGCQVTIDFPGV
jgi:signal transduction histidine kinase